MTSISNIPGQNTINQFNYQNKTTGTSHGDGTSGATGTSNDPASGLAGQHAGALPPIILALETLIKDISAAALAPTSKGGTEKAHHHHHGGGGGAKGTDASSSGASTGSTSSDKGTPESQTEQLANASQLINQLWNTTDGTINQLAKIVIMEAADESREAQDQAQSDTDAAKASLLNQAASLNKEADQMRAGAAVSLVMTVVSSAIQIGFAVGSLKMSGDAIGKMNEAKLPGANSQEILQESQNIGNRSSAIGQFGQAFSGLASGFGNFASTMYQADAKDTEAEGDVQAAQAQDLQGKSQAAQKIADDMNKLVDQIVDLIKEMGDAEAQMMQSMTRV